VEVGDLVRVTCNNGTLTGNVGVVVLSEHNEKDCPPYGLCVMIDGNVYGFLPDELEILCNP